MKIKLITIFIITILGIGLYFLFKDKMNKNINPDLIRLEHLEYWTGLIEEYHEKTGKYPLEEKIKLEDKIGLVRISNEKQSLYFNPNSDKYLEEIDYNKDKTYEEFTTKELIEDLENKLGKKVEEKYDILEKNNKGIVWYNYDFDKSGYTFDVTCNICGISNISGEFKDLGIYTIGVASKNLAKKLPEYYSREELLENNLYLWVKNNIKKYDQNGIKNLELELSKLENYSKKQEAIILLNNLENKIEDKEILKKLYFNRGRIKNILHENSFDKLLGFNDELEKKYLEIFDKLEKQYPIKEISELRKLIKDKKTNIKKLKNEYNTGIKKDILSESTKIIIRNFNNLKRISGKGYHNSIISDYKKSIKLGNTNPEIYLNLSKEILEYSINDDLNKESLDLIDKSILYSKEQNNNDILEKSYYRKSVLYSSLPIGGKFDKPKIALENIKKALELNPDNEIYKEKLKESQRNIEYQRN